MASEKSLEINFLGIKLANPIFASSGCFGFGFEYEDYFSPNELGGFCLKGLTLEPREGNKGVRIAETASGMLNSVGLENPGIVAFKSEILPRLKKEINCTIAANINGSVISDYVQMASELDGEEQIEIIELNVSCPNVRDGGMAFGANPEKLRQVVKEVRAATSKPLLVKLSPNVTDIVLMGKIAENEGADGLSLINTVLGMAIDTKTRKPLLGNTFGGLSGAAVKPIALRMIYQLVASGIALPILGMGGIRTGADALEFMLAGATAISVGTHLFENPLLPREIKAKMLDFLEASGTKNIGDIVGFAQTDDGKKYREILSGSR